MPDVALTQARMATLSVGDIPALYSWSELYRRKGVKLTSIRDLSDKRIAVLAGSLQAPYLETMFRSFGIHNARLIRVDSLSEGFRMAASGEVDAVAANNFFGSAEALNHGLESTAILFQPTQLFFAAGKGRGRALLQGIDDYLGPWEKNPDSPYYQILNRWKVTSRRIFVPEWFWWGVDGLVGLLILTLGTALLLRRQVVEKIRSLKISEGKLAAILDSVDSYIYIKDLNLKYQYVNGRVAAMFGLPMEKILGQTDAAFFDQETAQRISEFDRKVIEQGVSLTMEEDIRRRDGKSLRSYLTVKQPLYDVSGQLYALCGISTDFTEFKRSQEKIHQLAFYDSLTQLPNRRLLLERAEHALADHARSRSDGALLFIDLDNFKVLNDTLGHAQGDVLLQQATKRLSRKLRDNDTLARWGGDEFVLLMENLGEDSEEANRDVEVVARKLLESFNEPFQLDNRVYNITASIGVSMLSDAGDGVDDLLKRADLAMYEAKSAGRNLLKFFNPLMQASLVKRTAIETELHEALQRQQFALYYQPQVQNGAGVIGLEALIRWRRPEQGTILPGEFIRVAELTGQILELGRWIMHKACLQLADWAKDPLCEHLVVAVNVSARELHQPNFVDTVFEILDETGANPERLELELTENLLAGDTKGLVEKMLALKRRGVRFSLDDFGTGYSSLSCLKRLPLDQLKIDGSFVRDLLTDPNDAAIVKTILALGASLNIEIIAEGVETGAQRDALMRLGCHRQQGFLFGHPVPAPELSLDRAVNALQAVT